jgi:hypothetical protein
VFNGQAYGEGVVAMMRQMRARYAALAMALAVGELAVPTNIVRAADSVPWDGPLQELDAALGRGNVDAALQAWQHAYAVALENGQWEGLAAVGDASARIATSGGDAADLGRARQAYHEAFVRARSEGSVDGILRVSDAYSRLGDHEAARRYRDAAVRLAVRQTSPGIFARIWARITGQYVR